GGSAVIDRQAIDRRPITRSQSQPVRRVRSVLKQPSDELKALVTDKNPMPSAELEELVSKRDPNCARADWLKVGMVINYETGGSEEGFALWNKWSTGPDPSNPIEKYKGIEDLQERWRSFGRSDNPVTINTLRRTDTATPEEFDELEVEQED